MANRPPKPGPDPQTLLHFSQHSLLLRRFSECRTYALQLHQLHPNFPGLSHILAVADVLLAAYPQTPATETLRNWYKIMQLDHFTHDTNLITKQFNHLHAVLNPRNNKFPFANEALGIVCDAWYVLSDPVKKAEFDGLLREVLEFGFWTVCPYCYYVYEFPKVYLGFCVRCPNEKCGRGFTCVEIDRPPVEVLTEGKYLCCGFVQVGCGKGRWSPFIVVNKRKGNENGNGDSEFVEISDDDDDDDDDNDDGVKEGVDVETKMADVGRMRKKSVAKNVKKVTGAGNRVRKPGWVGTENADGCEYF